jgi:hypothetical protein
MDSDRLYNNDPQARPPFPLRKDKEYKIERGSVVWLEPRTSEFHDFRRQDEFTVLFFPAAR